ncbi:general stress protein [Streptomyces phaeochromogenes]|uniref:general stress protein n=1 Tax=Streptomyces phaeochromogenes TaxID=1923 RepID=UPI0033F406A7
MNEQARRTIASYTTCQEAARAVDHLADQGLPVQRVAIIWGHDGAALHGAASGVPPGALIGWIFGLPAELRSVTGTSTSSAAWKSSRLQDGPAVI